MAIEQMILIEKVRSTKKGNIGCSGKCICLRVPMLPFCVSEGYFQPKSIPIHPITPSAEF